MSSDNFMAVTWGLLYYLLFLPGHEVGVRWTQFESETPKSPLVSRGKEMQMMFEPE